MSLAIFRLTMLFKPIVDKLSHLREKTRELCLKGKAVFRASDTTSPPIYRLSSESPFSGENILNEGELKQHYKALKHSGIRVMPYPFGQAMAILSDCDGSLRADYEGYRDLLINKFGLDFGDSFRLHQGISGNGNVDKDGMSYAFGCPVIFNYQFTLEELDEGMDSQPRLLPVEVVRECVFGNIDYLHGFSAPGPRVIWLKDVHGINARMASIRIPEKVEHKGVGRLEKPASFNAFKVPVLFIGIVFSQKMDVNINPVVHVHLCDGRSVIYKDTPEKPAVSGLFSSSRWYKRLPVFRENNTTVIPYFGLLKEIEIHFDRDTECKEIAGVFCLNADRSAILDMLRISGEQLNIRTNLFTDHSSTVFLNRSSEERHGKFNAARFARLPVPANYARMQGESGAYSCLGDDPYSVAYVLPELRNRFGIRFINPSGISGEAVSGLDPLNLISPSQGRDGTFLYTARRTKVPLIDSQGNPHHDDGLDQGARTFPLRLDSILEREDKLPLAWPFYTHLGNIMPKGERPHPYFPEDVLRKLQDRVFNISRTVFPEKRFWFTRGTILYDYCLMLRSLPGHIVREGSNTIRIEPWYDPILQKNLPISLNQLHGITFYVEDSALAKVCVGDEEAVHLLRNPADETGRQSVTVLGRGPSHTVFDDVDVVNRFGFRNEGGICYEWINDPVKAFRGRYYGRLWPGNSDTGRFIWRPKGLSPVGSQYFGYAIRKSSQDVRFGVFLSTKTGGTFYFGDKICLLEGLNLTAFYLFPSIPCASWQMLWAPFYNLTWNKQGIPGGPIPSHEIQEVVFAVEGKEGQYAELDRVVFMRPSTLDIARPNGCVLGGRLMVSGSNRIICIKYHTRECPLQERVEIPDSLGNFVFAGIPVGAIVFVWAEVDGKTIFPVQGEYTDVWDDNLTLMIE